ncbi:hypothetical protein AAMO2058_001368200 [Amorphochlora amoebiformis]
MRFLWAVKEAGSPFRIKMVMLSAMVGSIVGVMAVVMLAGLTTASGFSLPSMLSVFYHDPSIGLSLGVASRSGIPLGDGRAKRTVIRGMVDTRSRSPAGFGITTTTTSITRGDGRSNALVSYTLPFHCLSPGGRSPSLYIGGECLSKSDTPKLSDRQRRHICPSATQNTDDGIRKKLSQDTQHEQDTQDTQHTQHTQHDDDDDGECVTEIESVEMFEKILDFHKDTDTLVLLEVYAKWCRKCKFMLPKYDKECQIQPEVMFLRWDAEKEKDYMSKVLGIRGLPAFMVFRKGKRVDVTYASKQEDLQDFILDNL